MVHKVTYSTSNVPNKLRLDTAVGTDMLLNIGGLFDLCCKDERRVMWNLMVNVNMKVCMHVLHIVSSHL